MKIIYKYELEITSGVQELQVPKNSTILTIQVQNNKPCMWCEVDKNEEEIETILIEMFGTGWDIYEGMGVDRKYLQTIQINGFVWHYYERLF
jgi:hypothetical protein